MSDDDLDFYLDFAFQKSSDSEDSEEIYKEFPWLRLESADTSDIKTHVVSSPPNNSDRDEDEDYELDQFEDDEMKAYLRFREVVVCSKQQLRKITLEHYRNLLDEANTQYFQAMSGSDYYVNPNRLPVNLLEAHLKAFRLSNSPGFFATNLQLTSPPSLKHPPRTMVTAQSLFVRPDASVELSEAVSHLSISTEPISASILTAQSLLLRPDACVQVEGSSSPNTITEPISASILTAQSLFLRPDACVQVEGSSSNVITSTIPQTVNPPSVKKLSRNQRRKQRQRDAAGLCQDAKPGQPWAGIEASTVHTSTSNGH